MRKNYLLRRGSQSLSYVTILFFVILMFSCNDTETIVQKNTITADSEVVFGSGSAVSELAVETDVPSENLSVSVASDGQSWCNASMENGILKISVADNDKRTNRVTIISLAGKNKRQDILVKQKALGFAKDKQLKVSNVTATSSIEGEHDAIHMIDGDLTTYHNSKVGAITEWPFLLDFYFEDVDSIDYLTYIPRQDGGNKWGAIGKLELWIATKENPTLVKQGDYDFGQVLSTSSNINFNKAVKNPTQIQFRVLSGFENRVSCAEMQFFVAGKSSVFDYMQIFSDKTCSEIKSGVTIEQINKISDLFFKRLALSIHDGTYDKEFRVQEYRPYQHPDIMPKELKTEKYSLRDNATGMYVENKGDELVVFVGDSKGQNLSLNIRDFQTNAESNYSLVDGLNVFTVSNPGLIYVYNHTPDPIPLLLTTDADKKAAAAKTVKINFATGSINGYFDIQKHSTEDWTRILSKYGTNTEIDVLGKRSHITWRTSDYRDNNTDIILMTNYMDSMIEQQNEMMGLFYYKKEFKNRAYIHVDYSAPAAYATSYRTAYSLGYINVFCTEAGLLSRMWVIGHEIGHVNQTRPGIKWAGTTEVTNNLFAMYNQQSILGDAVRLNTGVDSYEMAFDAIINKQQPWILPNDYGKHMLKIPPFWQLKLYFVDILKQEHFYHDIFEYYRVTPDLSQAVLGDNFHGMLQLDFVRQVCKSGKMNMIEYFEAWGFLRPVDCVVDDYGNKTMRINQQQIDELKAEIEAKNYPKPAIKVQDLTDLNYRQYIN